MSAKTDYKPGDGVVLVDDRDRARAHYTVESVGGGWVNCNGMGFRPEDRHDVRLWRFGDGREIERHRRASKVSDFDDWDRLTVDEMDAVWEILAKYRTRVSD